MVQSSVNSTLISVGYAAFNADDWDTVRALFSPDDPDGNFPVFYPMDHWDHPITGRDNIVKHLQGLRGAGLEARLLAVADHGQKSITLDITTGGGDPHACADEVEFDEHGLIKVFKHCAAATHDHHEHPGS
jgi:hypothetical protein